MCGAHLRPTYYRKEPHMIPPAFDYITGYKDTAARHRDLMDMPLAAMNVPNILALNTRKAQQAYQYGRENGFSVLLGEKEGLSENIANNYKVQRCIIQHKVLDYFLREGIHVLPIIHGRDGRYWIASTHLAVACELIKPASCIKDWVFYVMEWRGDGTAALYDPHCAIPHNNITGTLVKHENQKTYPAGLVPYTVCDFMLDNSIDESTFINHTYFPERS